MLGVEFNLSKLVFTVVFELYGYIQPGLWINIAIQITMSYDNFEVNKVNLFWIYDESECCVV